MSDTLGLAAAIDGIARLATENQTTRIVETKAEPNGMYYLIGPGGTRDLVTARPDWHSEKLDTPAELARFTKDHKQEGSATFYDQNRIVFVNDLQDRRGRATCDLLLSPQYQWLLQASGQPMTQKDFVRTLRITFQGCHDGQLLALVRNLKFSSGVEAAGAIQQGRESMQRSTLQEVRGEAAIPEETAMIIPVYQNHPYNAKIGCAVEVIADSMCFKLTPYPLALKRAIDEAIDDIAGMFADEGMPPAYCGSPE